MPKNPHAVELGKLRMAKLGKKLSRYQSAAAKAKWRKWRKLRGK